MKTLIKLAKGRTSIPILGQVHADEQFITATDMDIYIKVPNPGLDPAMYYPHGFEKKIFIKSDLPVKDFPEPRPNEYGHVVGKITLDKHQIEAFQWLIIAASKETTRYYLNGVFFDKERIVATDGHRLHMLDLHPEWVNFKEGTIMPTVCTRNMLAIIAEQKAESVEIEIMEKGFKCVIGKTILLSKFVDGTYPKYESVIPKNPKENITPFDPEEIKALMPELQILNKVNHNTRTIALEFEKGVMRYHGREYKVSFAPQCVIGFNAKYLTECCPGVANYGDESSPMIITDRRGKVKRTTIQMPLRV